MLEKVRNSKCGVQLRVAVKTLLTVEFIFLMK